MIPLTCALVTAAALCMIIPSTRSMGVIFVTALCFLYPKCSGIIWGFKIQRTSALMGSRTVNVAPSPGWLSTRNSP